MKPYAAVLYAALIIAVATVLTPSRPFAADEPAGGDFVRVVVEAEKIPIDDDLRLREWFDNRKFYGMITSQEELDKLWAEQISAKKPYASRLGIGIPEPPKVDFDSYTVIWFSDKGADASFVDSILVSAYNADRKVFVTFVAYHSDFVSKRLNLWKVPLTGYSPEFSVLHKYEEGAP